jgi:hypothetical protein
LPVLEPERQSYAIVVLGDFNPSIFQPLWFSLNGLVPEEEAKNADIAIVHKQIASFSIGKIQVQVDDSRLGLTTVESPQGPILRDLAIGTLSILEHTPLKAIGLNRDMVFAMQTDEAWHEVGNRLVPKKDWEQVFDLPGMRQVIVEGHRSDCSASRSQVRVQPSANHGVLIAVNQHYQLESEQRVEVRDRHREAIRVLQDDWTSFATYARDAAEKLLHVSQSCEQTEQQS